METFGESLESDDEPLFRAPTGSSGHFDYVVPLGDEYPKCPAEYVERGKLVANSMIGKDRTEIVCVALRARGFKVDWHFVETRVLVKTLEQDPEPVREAWDEELERRKFVRL